MTENKKTTPTAIEVVRENDKGMVAHQNGVVESDYDIDAFLQKRAEFITKVNKIMVDGKDFHVIQGKKSLAKGGAEKIASIFGWQADFRKDTEVFESLGLAGFIPFICRLSKLSVFVGEGRGGASLERNGKDPNKTIKMAQKSAFIDAVLRASGLSDFFTQDLEDMPKDQISSSTQTPEAEFFCDTHDRPLVIQPAGVSKQGKTYKAFWKCNEKIDGKFCKGPFINSNGVRVRQHPETGEMVPDQVDYGNDEKYSDLPGMNPESSVDKARRILDAKIPPNHGKDFPE